jgi:hypothetical protein
MLIKGYFQPKSLNGLYYFLTYPLSSENLLGYYIKESSHPKRDMI